MKINDLEFVDIDYRIINNIDNDIGKLQYHQKYLLLELGNEIYSLEIVDVTDTAFYLKIKEDECGAEK